MSRSRSGSSAPCCSSSGSLDLGVRVVVAVTLVLTIAWLVVALLAYRRYREGVLALVTARPWEPLDLLDSDDEVVKGLLASADARDVTVGLSAVNGRRRLLGRGGGGPDDVRRPLRPAGRRVRADRGGR